MFLLEQARRNTSRANNPKVFDNQFSWVYYYTYNCYVWKDKNHARDLINVDSAEVFFTQVSLLFIHLNKWVMWILEWKFSQIRQLSNKMIQPYTSINCFLIRQVNRPLVKSSSRSANDIIQDRFTLNSKITQPSV